MTTQEQLDYARESVSHALRVGHWEGRDFWHNRIKELEKKLECECCKKQ